MTLRRPAAVLALALALTACGYRYDLATTDDRPTEAGPHDLSRCGASDLADAPGKRLVEGEAGSGEVSQAMLPFPHRVIAPGESMTQDFRPERLTILTDETGRVTALRCG